MRCPVEGCEPWESLEATCGTLPQSQAMLPTGVGRLERCVEDPRKMDMASLTATSSASFREHGYQLKGLEGVVKHWQCFYERKGRCFAAPCCSRTPTQCLSGTCHELSFPSLSTAVDHMVDCHGEEVREQQDQLRHDHEQ
jgi:hypothetical protein